jgi:hypothetical protein
MTLLAPDFTQDSTGALADRFPKGLRAVKPYLRPTPQPNR